MSTPLSMMAMTTRAEPKPCAASQACGHIGVEAHGAHGGRQGVVIGAAPVQAGQLRGVVVAPVRGVVGVAGRRHREGDPVQRHGLHVLQRGELVRQRRQVLDVLEGEHEPAVNAGAGALVRALQRDVRPLDADDPGVLRQFVDGRETGERTGRARALFQRDAEQGFRQAAFAHLHEQPIRDIGHHFSGRGRESILNGCERPRRSLFHAEYHAGGQRDQQRRQHQGREAMSGHVLSRWVGVSTPLMRRRTRRGSPGRMQSGSPRCRGRS